MKQWQVLGVLVIVMGWSLLIAACGPKALLLEEQPYHNAEGGYSIRYPKGWECFGSGFWVTLSPPAGEKGHLSVTVSIFAFPLEDFGLEEATDAQEMLEVLLGGFSQNTTSAQGMVGILYLQTPGVEETSQVRSRKLGQMEIAYIDDIEKTADPVLSGRIAAVHLDRRGILIYGYGKPADWEGFLPTFEAMLMSMVFFEPGRQL